MTQENVATPAPPAGETTTGPAASAPPPAPPRLNNLQLFLIFSHMSLMGFGGVMPQAFHQMVEKRKLVTAGEFGELLVFCQIMPGPTICTLSLVYGHRQNGVPGAIAGALGMTFFPLVIVLILGVLYQNFSDIVLVQHALKGMAVVAAGLFASTGVKLLMGLPHRWLPWGIAAVMIAVVSYFRIPIPLALLVAAPIAVWLQYRRERETDARAGTPGSGAVSDQLVNLALLFGNFVYIAMLGVGGGILAVFPEVQRVVVDVYHWMTTQELTTALALGQAAPGPNFLFVALIGWHVAGLAGAVVAFVAAIGPTSALALFVWTAKERQAALGPLGRAMRVGLMPVAAGLMTSTGLLLSLSVTMSWHDAVAILVTLVVMIRIRPNPMWLVGLGAVLGGLGVI